MSAIEPIASHALELRQAFDQAFAAPATGGLRQTLDVIVIKLAGEVFALRVGEIAGLYADTVVTPCPGPLPELLGIAGFRGTVVPVYDLGALLGHKGGAGRWLVLTRDRELALAFEAFDGHLRVEPTAVALRQDKAARHVAEVVRLADRSLPLVDLSSVLATIRSRAAASRKED